MSEAKARRRSLSVFSLSFLDAMTCGFGAVVLLYMVINAATGLRTDRLTGQLKAEAERLDVEVLEGHRNLVELRNSIRETERQDVVARGLSARLIEMIKELEIELSTYEETTLARQEHINKLMADLKALEESNRRLSASAPREEEGGDKVRSYVGDGDRQYLTGLKVGGQRVLILVDASASMLGSNLVNIIRRRNLPPERRVLSDKWQHALASVDWLTTQIPSTSQFQIYVFNETTKAVLSDTKGQWLNANDPEVLDGAVEKLRQVVPEKGTSLLEAFRSIDTLVPVPDNVILLTDGLPTLGKSSPKGSTINARQRLKLFDQAYDEVPRGVPMNILLYPMEGDPRASSSFWQLAMATRGSFMSLSEDWP
jgi:hypothetical protein